MVGVKVAAYIRVSTDRQRDGFSPDVQRKAALERGADEALIFEDAASGASDQRPAFQEMMHAAQHGRFDRLLVWKLSRFGRNTEDVLRNLRVLEELDIEVIFIEDGISTGGPAAKMVYTMLAVVGEMERDNIRSQARAGMVESASQGRWQGGVPPFGTRLGEDGFLVEDPEAAQTLRMASAMLLAGRSTQEVSETLNAQGRRPPRASEWKSSELRRHLRRPHLKGEMTWDGLATVIPSIIDDETWLRVQRTLDSSSLPRRSGRANTDSWPLSERVACSCGGYLIGVGRRRGIRYYRCSNHLGDRKGLCTCDHDASPERPRWWRADDLDTIAWEQLVLVLSNRDVLEAAINRSLGRTTTGVSDPAIIQRVRRRVASLEAGLVAARADLYEADDADRDLASRTVAALTERLRSARDELHRMEFAAEDRERTESRLSRWITFASDSSFRIDPPPPTPEMQRVFTDLDVRGQIRTSAERELIERRLPKPSWSGVRSIRFAVPPPFLRIESFYIDDGAARPFPCTRCW